VSHAQAHPDAEVCGILGGTDGRVQRVFEAANISETPRTRFLMEPRDQKRAFDDIDDANLDLVGFYHSHTHTQAYPSETDVRMWTEPGWAGVALCFICSLQDAEHPLLRAFNIAPDGAITEEPITIE